VCNWKVRLVTGNERLRVLSDGFLLDGDEGHFVSNMFCLFGWHESAAGWSNLVLRVRARRNLGAKWLVQLHALSDRRHSILSRS
jgi:hypothetical protein